MKFHALKGIKVENRNLKGIKIFADIIAEHIVEKMTEKHDRPEYLSPKTIAQILDCSVSEVRKHLQENAIPTLRFGNRGYRVSREEFMKRLIQWEKGGELWE